MCCAFVMWLLAYVLNFFPRDLKADQLITSTHHAPLLVYKVGLECPLQKVNWFFMREHAKVSRRDLPLHLNDIFHTTWQRDSIILLLTQIFSIWKTGHLLHDRWVFFFFFFFSCLVGLLCTTGIVIIWNSLLLWVWYNFITQKCMYFWLFNVLF